MSAPNALQSTVKLYHTVIEEVIGNVKEAFLDEGVDDAVLHELKQIWEAKVLASKAVDNLDPNHVKTTNASLNSALNVSSSQRTLRHVELDTRIQPKTAKSFEPFHHSAEYNPSTSCREGKMLQVVPPGFLSADGLNTTPISSLVRCMPQQSVITNAQNGLFIQMQGIPKSFTVHQANNIFPNPMTSSLMMSSSGRNVAIKRQDAEPAPTASLTIPGSNVIVAPSVHLPTPMNRVGQSSSKMAANNARTNQRPKVIVQLDGPVVMSDDDDDDSIEEEVDIELNVDSVADEACSVPVEEGAALNSEDDEVSNENADEMFEADDVVVCQFEKVSRIRNKWKFILKDGIINLGHKDYVFNKALGEAEF